MSLGLTKRSIFSASSTSRKEAIGGLHDNNDEENDNDDRGSGLDVESGRCRFRHVGAHSTLIPSTPGLAPSSSSSSDNRSSLTEDVCHEEDVASKRRYLSRWTSSPRLMLQSCLAKAAAVATTKSSHKSTIKGTKAPPSRQAIPRCGGQGGRDEKNGTLARCCQHWNCSILRRAPQSCRVLADEDEERGQRLYFGNEGTILSCPSRTMEVIYQFVGASIMGGDHLREESTQQEHPLVHPRNNYHPHYVPVSTNNASSPSSSPLTPLSPHQCSRLSPPVGAVDPEVGQLEIVQPVCDGAIVEEKQNKYTARLASNRKGSMNTGQTGETSIETDDSEIPIIIPPAVVSTPAYHPHQQSSSSRLVDYSLCKVDLEDAQHHRDLNVTFRSFTEKENNDGGASSTSSDGESDDVDSITRTFVNATSGPMNVLHQSPNKIGTMAEVVDAPDCNPYNSDNATVHFFLRLPNATSLKQQQKAKLERAERTADFMETAKALSLKLVRNKGSRRKPQRSISSSSQSTPTKVFAVLGRRSSFHSGQAGGAVIADSGNLMGMVDSLRRAPPGPTSSHKISRQDVLETTANQTTLNMGINAGEGKYSPRRHQQRTVTPLPMAPVSRENSIDSLHQLLEHDQQSPRRSPLLLRGTLKMALQKQQVPQQQQSEPSMMSESQKELALQRQLLGYEDVDVPLKTGNDDVMNVERGSFPSSWTGTGPGSPLATNSGPRKLCSPSAVEQEQGGKEDIAEMVMGRTQRRRVQRRSSFVAGSKIEQFDDPHSHNHHHTSSSATFMNGGQDEYAGGGSTRRKATRRPSLSSGSMSIESYNEWKIEMMAHNG